MTRDEALDYEVRASWWACWCPFHRLSGRYFAWKLRRKWARYIRSANEAVAYAERLRVMRNKSADSQHGY